MNTDNFYCFEEPRNNLLAFHESYTKLNQKNCINKLLSPCKIIMVLSQILVNHEKQLNITMRRSYLSGKDSKPSFRMHSTGIPIVIIPELQLSLIAVELTLDGIWRI